MRGILEQKDSNNILKRPSFAGDVTNVYKLTLALPSNNLLWSNKQPSVFILQINFISTFIFLVVKWISLTLTFAHLAKGTYSAFTFFIGVCSLGTLGSFFAHVCTCKHSRKIEVICDDTQMDIVCVRVGVITRIYKGCWRRRSALRLSCNLKPD